MGSGRLGAHLWGAAAVLALCALACIAVVWPGGTGDADMALMSATKERFLDKLNNILLKKTNKKMIGSEDSVLKAQESIARARRGRGVTNMFSKAQLAANACADGGPCGDTSPKPKMVYQPSTGNWIVEDAGNPDWIWQHLMQHAKQRDSCGENVHR